LTDPPPPPPPRRKQESSAAAAFRQGLLTVLPLIVTFTNEVK